MRVVTWNVWWRFGPWEKRRHAILAVLRELRPDVVGLQEVWATGDENLARWLAEELGLHWTWAASDAPQRWQRRNGETDVDFGNAVLSRWPIADREVLRLPSAARYEDGRLVLHTRLDVPGGPPVPFFTTRLTSDIDASAVRCAQVRELVGFVARHRGDGPYPAVITGDFAWYEHRDSDAKAADFPRPEVVPLVDAALVDVAAARPDHPDTADVRHLLAYFLTRQGRYDAALEQFRIVDGYVDALPWRYWTDPAAVYCGWRDRAVRGARRR
ncbi:endonuclease/exonuclease/phosphatase family protein [Streptomyces sp. HNM0645]|uniref:endonuclease/exonuclease/phosphatase family protein n=1 Tax=Streptomyces sp. HNM0645 TaxID=2782343 RepID=UPI0024B79658|nr:endonuclease/exonuclease/phosphatase family protein [Streptomyces sp. HNM0645]MDI9886838.1 endonuclease/exonuclease/phosphatase family protein [Streptomyces sp. HNM0645]